MKVATDTENTADFGQLTDQLQKGNRQTLHYSRSRFLMTWLALGLLAILIGITMLVALRQADTNLEQTDDIARVANTTADAAAEDTDQIVAYMRGEQGIPGVPGANGTDGTPGLPGQGGAPGEQGPQGPRGETGATGATGAMGLMGVQGPLGQTGPLGTKGEAGPNGSNGVDGQNGANGAEGPQGQPGPQGEQGPQGERGPQGPPFIPVTATAVGTSVNDPSSPKTANATCPNGFISGGGWAISPSDPGIITTHSAPVGTTGWAATAVELSLPADQSWQLLVFAVCVTASLQE